MATYLLCPPGSYCPLGSADPLPCPRGTFSDSQGLSTPCTNCTGGYYCPNTGEEFTCMAQSTVQAVIFIFNTISSRHQVNIFENSQILQTLDIPSKLCLSKSLAYDNLHPDVYSIFRLTFNHLISQ